MIRVTDVDGTQYEFVDGARFFTDEHNNLCIEDARELLIRVFALGKWHDVEVSIDAD